MPQASSLKAALSKALGIEATLIEGDRGVFDVARDGTVIFSKHKTGRFPKDSEIIKALR